jgi:predicted nucleic acid-binding protein
MDTNTIVAAMRSPSGASAALLRAARRGRITLTATIPLCLEYEDVCRPQLRDPGDELVLEAAVNAQADAIATFNRRDFRPAAGRFGIDILLPAEAIRRVP